MNQLVHEGQSFKLLDFPTKSYTQSSNILVNIKYNHIPLAHDFVVDMGVLLLGKDGMAIYPTSLVSYDNPGAPGIELMAYPVIPGRTTPLIVDLEHLPSEVECLQFLFSIYNSSRCNYSVSYLDFIHFEICDIHTGLPLAEYHASDKILKSSVASVLLLSTINKTPRGWSFSPKGIPLDKSYKAVCRDQGIDCSLLYE